MSGMPGVGSRQQTEASENTSKEGRKEGRKVRTEGWRKRLPINNTPRRGATVAAPIIPTVARILCTDARVQMPRSSYRRIVRL